MNDVEVIRVAGHLFDRSIDDAAAARFVTAEGHHLLLAYAESEPVGMVTGIEMTDPDKGTEMFVYELGVAERHRGRGVGTTLVTALRELARERGCYGMWVLADTDNKPALATYAAAGGTRATNQVMLEWDLRR